MATLKAAKQTAQANMIQRIYDYKRSRYIKYFREMSQEDRDIADRDNLEEATAIGTIVAEEIYAMIRKARKPVITLGTGVSPGTPFIAQSLPVTAAPDVNSGALVYGADPEFDLINPEN